MNVIIDGDTAEVAVMLVKRRDGGEFRTLIDYADVPLVAGRKWRAVFDPSINGHYIHGGNGVLLHRIIARATPGVQVDHDNHDTLDNRRQNLILKSPTHNQLNRRGSQRNNKLGLRGVRREGNRFRARVKFHRKNHELGYFDDQADAAKVVEAFLLGIKLAAEESSFGCRK